MNNWQGNNNSGNSWNRPHANGHRPVPSRYPSHRTPLRQNGRTPLPGADAQYQRPQQSYGAALPRSHQYQQPPQHRRPATHRHFSAAHPHVGGYQNPPYPETDLGYSESDSGQYGEESHYGSDHIEPPPQSRIPLQTPQPRSRGPSRRQSFAEPQKYDRVQTLTLSIEPQHIYFDVQLHPDELDSKRPVPNRPRLLKESRERYCLGSPANRKAVLEHVGKQMLAVIRIYRQARLDLQEEDRVKMRFVSAGRAACNTSKKSCRDKACQRYVLTPNSLLVDYHEVLHMPRLVT